MRGLPGRPGPDPETRLLLGLTAVLALAAFLTPFVFRGLDDNRLTPWQWVFAPPDVLRIAAILTGGLALAYALSRLALPRICQAPALGLAAALAAGAFSREPEVIVDAARYFTQAKHLETYGVGHFLAEWGRGIPAWTDLPLVPFLYGVLFGLLGEGRAAVQALTTLLFAGTVLLTYGIGRRLWDDTVGVYGAALLLAMPYLLTQVPLMLVDVSTMFFVALAVWASLRALERGGAGSIVLAAGAVALMLLAKYSTWPLLSVVPLAALAQPDGRGRALGRAAAIAAAGAGLAGLLLLPKLDVVGEQLRLLWGYQVPGLARWRESVLSTLVFQIHPFVTAAAAWSAVVALRRRDSRWAVVAWPVLLVAASGIGRIRYAVPVLPMLALMAAYGLREVGRVEVRRFAAAAAVASSLVVAFFGYLPYLTTASAVNVRDAGGYLDRIGVERAEVFALPQPGAGINPAVSVPLLDLFTAARLVYRQPPAAPPDGIEGSPLRFTWQYRNPPYYAADAAGVGAGAVVVILAHADQSLPAPVERALGGHRLVRAFETRDRWFQYQTVVRVYRPVGMAAGERS